MRNLLFALVLLFACDSRAQDTLRRVQGESVVVSGVAAPIDSLPLSSSFRSVTPTQLASSNSLEQALRAVPGVQVDNRNNYALGDRITMRGMGARSFFGVRGVRVMKDDVPLTFADGQTNLEILDPTQIGSIRVLRGPTASIFGNASGGTLLLRSVQPPSPGSIIRAAATMGSWGYQRYGASLGDVVGDIAYGAYVTLDSATGYRDWNGMKALHFGTQAVYTFGDDALTLAFDNVSFSAQNPGALSQKLLDSNRRMAYGPNRDRKTGKDGKQSQIGLTYHSDLGEDELTTTGYAILRSVENPTPQQIVALDRDLFGLRSFYAAGDPASDFVWSGVLDLQYQSDARVEHSNNAGSKGILQTDQDETIFNVGLGAHATYKLAEVLGVSAGLRYDLLQFSAKDKLINDSNRDESGEVTMSALSPSLGLLYTGLGDHHFFANASLNFESPTSTELANQPDGSGGYNSELAPQRNTSIEIGWRGRISDRIRYNAALFTTQIRDALIQFEVAGQEGRTFYRNAGSITNKGAELELIAEPFDGLRATLGYTYIDSRFTDYIVIGDTLNGNRQPGVQPHMGSMDVMYHTPFGLYLNASAKLAAKVAVNDANTFHAPEYTVVDLKAGYRLAIDEFGKHPLVIEPYVHVMNLFDRKYIGSYAINAFGGRYYEPAPERSIYAGVQISL